MINVIPIIGDVFKLVGNPTIYVVGANLSGEPASIGVYIKDVRENVYCGSLYRTHSKNMTILGHIDLPEDVWSNKKYPSGEVIKMAEKELEKDK